MGAPPLLLPATTFSKLARSSTALTSLTNSGIFGNINNSREESADTKAGSSNAQITDGVLKSLGSGEAVTQHQMGN